MPYKSNIFVAKSGRHLDFTGMNKCSERLPINFRVVAKAEPWVVKFVTHPQKDFWYRFRQVRSNKVEKTMDLIVQSARHNVSTTLRTIQPQTDLESGFREGLSKSFCIFYPAPIISRLIQAFQFVYIGVEHCASWMKVS